LPSIIQKGFYYTRLNDEKSANVGVLKKCKAQCKAFEDCGVRMDFLTYSGQGVKLNGAVIKPMRFGNLFEDSLKFLSIWDLSLLKLVDFSAYDIIYIRYPLCHPMFMYFLARLKRMNRRVKLIVEFPTFPYYLELSSRGYFFQGVGFIDRFCRRFLRYWVDLAVHYGMGQVLRLPTLNLTNGVGQVGRSKVAGKAGIRKTNIIAIGSWNYWHGIDRLLQGLVEHKGMKVNVVIIGSGPAVLEWKKYASASQPKVDLKFLPHLSEQELGLYLKEADLAIGSLGMFRKRVFLDSSLKHRTYCAESIPFVLATEDPDFPPALPFVHYVAADNTPIDIIQLLQWLSQLRADFPNYQQEMRNYAIEHLSWNVRIKQVLKAIYD